MEERGTRDDKPMKPQVVAWELGKRLRDERHRVGAIPARSPPGWRGIFRARRGQMFSLSGNLATMACGLPYAIAAQIAYPDRQCVAFVGDGGFSMLMAEFATAVKYQLPIKIVVIKNNTLGQIKWEQMVFLGQPGIRLRPAADRLRRVCARLRRHRLHRSTTRSAAAGPVEEALRNARPGAGRGRRRSARAADAAEDHCPSRPRTSPSRSHAARPRRAISPGRCSATGFASCFDGEHRQIHCIPGTECEGRSTPFLGLLGELGKAAQRPPSSYC